MTLEQKQIEREFQDATATHEFCVEARKGKLFANEWQPVGTVSSIEAARGMRKDYEDGGYEVHILVREVTPWRELSDASDSKASV